MLRWGTSLQLGLDRLSGFWILVSLLRILLQHVSVTREPICSSWITTEVQFESLNVFLGVCLIKMTEEWINDTREKLLTAFFPITNMTSADLQWQRQADRLWTHNSRTSGREKKIWFIWCSLERTRKWHREVEECQQSKNKSGFQQRKGEGGLDKKMNSGWEQINSKVNEEMSQSPDKQWMTLRCDWTLTEKNKLYAVENRYQSHFGTFWSLRNCSTKWWVHKRVSSRL